MLTQVILAATFRVKRPNQHCHSTELQVNEVKSQSHKAQHWITSQLGQRSIPQG